MYCPDCILNLIFITNHWHCSFILEKKKLSNFILLGIFNIYVNFIKKVRLPIKEYYKIVYSMVLLVYDTHYLCLFT